MNIIIKNILSGLLLFGILSLVNADDTDIINSEIPVDSNVLFVMDMSGSMDSELGSDSRPNPYQANLTRAGVLKTALQTVLSDSTLRDINVGITSFSGDRSVSGVNQTGHGISYPIAPIDGIARDILDWNITNNSPLNGFNHKVDTVESGTITITSLLPLANTPAKRLTRDYIGNGVPEIWSPYGSTPIVDALYEAALYFRGSDVDFGKADPSQVVAAHPSSYKGLLYTKTGPVTIPVLQSCGRPSEPACNGSEATPCPTVTDEDWCTDNSSYCTSLENDGYTCGPAQRDSGVSSCDLSSCQSNAGCDESVIRGSYNTACSLSDESSCMATGNYASCSTSSESGPCISWYEGSCTAYGPDVDVINCDVNTYNCPYDNMVKRCTKDVEACVHETFPVDTELKGTATYVSPIKNECSKNSIILLSDGRPTANSSAVRVASLIGSINAAGCTSDSFEGRCGTELLQFLSSSDQSATQDGDQFVTTHSIGLSLSNDPQGEQYLRDLASAGGGFYVSASTPQSLAAALKGTFTASASKARSFSSPTYTPDAGALFAHGDFVYVPVFDKGLGPLWYGNFKKYKRINGQLFDADGLRATDDLGGIKKTARDFWSAVPSVHAVKSGGVGGKIDPATRSALTDNGTGSLIPLNTSLPAALFGSSVTFTHKQNLVKFIRGEKNDGTPRHHMGDIIHSKAIHLKYPGNKEVLFIGTNEGYLHAINDSNIANDPNSGKELFAYMPRELLKNIDLQFRNDALDKHVYGVDGEITLSHDDKNQNGVVDGVEKAILYFGLRRGGQAYYALDVSSRLNPRLLWKKKRGDSGFSDLGFSWSKPTVAKMKVGSTAEEVLIFGGGYIDDNGVLGLAETDTGSTTRGSLVYIVNASTGQRLWKGNTGYAVPSGIRVLDINKDGLADRLYFADTGGNVWRVIFDSSDINTQTSVIPKKFADLSGSGRKFFVEPDVALFKHKGQYMISVALGSGERPKPLVTTSDDQFFVMFDTDLHASPSSPLTAITKSALYDSSLMPLSGSLSGGKKGWYKDLGGAISGLDGEKVLSRATTYDGIIFFNTFGTTSITQATCGLSNVNQSRLYALDLFNGGPLLDLDGDGTPREAEDESKLFAVGEIPGAPQILFDKPTSKNGGNCVQGDCIRKDSVNSAKGEAISIRENGGNGLGLGAKLRKVYWLDVE